MDIATCIATVADAGELARLNYLFNEVSTPPDEIASHLSEPGCVETPILAKVEGRAVGFASIRIVSCVFYASPHAELTELFVEAAYRQHGVGRALIEHAERLARERGAFELWVLTDFANAGSLALYRNCGYQDAELALCKGLQS